MNTSKVCFAENVLKISNINWANDFVLVLRTYVVRVRIFSKIFPENVFSKGTRFLFRSVNRRLKI